MEGLGFRGCALCCHVRFGEGATGNDAGRVCSGRCKAASYFGAVSAGKFEAVKVCEEKGYVFSIRAAENPFVFSSDPDVRLRAMMDNSATYNGKLEVNAV